MTSLGGVRRVPAQLGLAGGLGVGAALLVACGSSSLIPPGPAGQLKRDFDAVAAAVASGSCDQDVKAAIAQTRTDLAALPTTLDPRLLAALQDGVRTLTTRAPIECRQQTTPTTTSTETSTTQTETTPTHTNTETTPTTTPTHTSTSTTPTPTPTTPTDTSTSTTPTPTTPRVVPENGGGTPAPPGQSGQVRPRARAAMTSGYGGGN